MRRAALFALFLEGLIQVSVVLGYPLGVKAASGDNTLNSTLAALAAILFTLGAIRSTLRPDQFTRIFAVIFALNAVLASSAQGRGANFALFPLSMLISIGLWWISGQEKRAKRS